MEAWKPKYYRNVEGKIQEDKSWALVVRRNVDEKLLHVKDDFEDIKSSIEEAKTKKKETKEFIKDEKDKEIRRNNVIIYKVAESKATDYVDEQKDDKIFCMRLLNEVLDMNCDEDLKKIFRLGKREDGKEKPLLLELKSPLLKNQMMESLSKLRDADEVFKKPSIAHDMTKVKRMEVTKLVDEAKERRKRRGNTRSRFEGLQENENSKNQETL